jgi:hypothetical protein
MERHALQMNCNPSSDDIFRSNEESMSEREWHVYVKIKTLPQLLHTLIGKESFLSPILRVWPAMAVIWW